MVHKVHGEHAMYNLAKVTEFCKELMTLEQSAKEKKVPIIYRTTREIGKKVKSVQKTNSIVLISIFLVVCKGFPLERLEIEFKYIDKKHYGKDKTQNDQTLNDQPLNWMDYIEAILMAYKIGWYSVQTFDVNQYIYYSNFINGDLNWVVPNEVLAFSSPCDDSKSKNS
jgi:hypothetical protein